jgi:hypothetical protein
MVAAAGLVACSQPAVSPPLPPVKPVATTKQLMMALTEPSNALFNVGIEPPTADEAWTSIQTNAVLVAEIGNLLLLGDRPEDQGDWVTFSLAMTDAGVAVLKAAESRDVEAATRAGDTLLETCSQCHTQYMD